MPNPDQLAFLASLFGGFFTLVYLSNILKAALVRAGYDYRHLILLGTPRKDDPTKYYGMDFSKDLVTLMSNPVVIASGAVAVVTLLWLVLGKKGGRKVLTKEWQEFPLEKKIQISPNTAIYRFSLPRPTDTLGLPTGKHISVGAVINGKDLSRSYTPVSSNDQLGSFDLLIKSYEKGNISKHFTTLKLGDNLRVKGPRGNFDYTSGLTGALGMIAGGSGITPMYQIINAVLKNPSDSTKLALIYANVSEEDILMRAELDQLAAAHPSRFTVYYVLNTPPAVWAGGVGFVTKEQIQTYLPTPTADAKILMCGPPPMLTAMKKHLDELSFPAPRTISKLEDKGYFTLGCTDADVTVQTVNLAEGENLQPWFLKLNPKGTLPTLECDGNVYTDTSSVVAKLVKDAPTKVKTGSSFIQTIHEDKYDPNFVLFLSRDEDELAAKKSSIAIPFLTNRQAVMEKYSKAPEGAVFKQFYDAKMQDNQGKFGLLSIIKGDAPEEHNAAFFAQSKAHYKNLQYAIQELLPSVLPERGFIGGDIPGEDDFHLAAWLTRLAAASGAKTADEALPALEAFYGAPVPVKVKSYWNSWVELPSWKKIYGAGLY
ncbi:unnamed protein product [Mycena citricolor]|uniref:NADH-cytochrome b5 reductase 1 n=1 Tax=Mycena citricolor TaxID=2018698 RepID=A0AAD2HRE2_9AGAR|nr:unnamed protein product [Mycena citricolor]